MQIKALINLVVAVNKEVPVGGEYDLNEAEAKALIDKGFAQAVIKLPQKKGQTDEKTVDKKNNNKSVSKTGK